MYITWSLKPATCLYDTDKGQFFLRCVHTSTSIRIQSKSDWIASALYYRVPQKPTECVTRYVVIGSRGCIRKRSLIETENKHPQARRLHHRQYSSRTIYDYTLEESGRWRWSTLFCVVFSSILHYYIPIKTDSFIHYLFAKNNIQLRLYICCTPDPQQSLRLFIGPVATSHLPEQFVPRV